MPRATDSQPQAVHATPESPGEGWPASPSGPPCHSVTCAIHTPRSWVAGPGQGGKRRREASWAVNAWTHGPVEHLLILTRRTIVGASLSAGSCTKSQAQG